MLSSSVLNMSKSLLAVSVFGRLALDKRLAMYISEPFLYCTSRRGADNSGLLKITSRGL